MHRLLDILTRRWPFGRRPQPIQPWDEAFFLVPALAHPSDSGGAS